MHIILYSNIKIVFPFVKTINILQFHLIFIVADLILKVVVTSCYTLRPILLSFLFIYCSCYDSPAVLCYWLTCNTVDFVYLFMWVYTPYCIRIHRSTLKTLNQPTYTLLSVKESKSRFFGFNGTEISNICYMKRKQLYFDGF